MTEVAKTSTGNYRIRSDAEAEMKPWVLHFHTSAGYGETIIRFRTRAEARKYRNELSWVKELVFYPIYKEKNEREESKGHSGGTHAERL